MDNVFGEQTNASATSDFVTDFLSGTQVKSMSTRDRSALPPKPAPRRRNRRPKEGQQVDENYTASRSNSTVKQALPPDDYSLTVNAQPAPVARLTESSESENQLNDFQSFQYKRETSVKPRVIPPTPEVFDHTHLLSISTSASGGEELLLASVPYHTLRIEPSPSLTLNTRKHRNSRSNSDRSHTGRLKSASSLSDDLDNLAEVSSFGEPTRSSSTPMLIGDGKHNGILFSICNILLVIKLILNLS